jgi:hypothetical protein
LILIILRFPIAPSKRIHQTDNKGEHRIPQHN